jgi:phenylacetate-CoA ligase
MKLQESFAFGEPVATGRLTPDVATTLVRQGRDRAAALRAMPIDQILEGLGRLRPLWGRGGAFRETFLRMRGADPRAQPMIELALDRFAAALVPGLLRRRLAAQLGDPACLDSFVPGGGRATRAEPLGTVLHVVSGEVFVEPVELLVASLITKNASVMRCPSGQEAFLRLFQKSLEEAAPELAAATAVLAWPGGNAEAEAAIAAHVDGIAVISRAGLPALSHAALARDVALWDQLASTAAQVIYVQGIAEAVATAGGLAAALEELENELPSQPGNLTERIEIARLRDTARFGEAAGAAKLFASTGQGLWTVVYEEDRRFLPSPLRRSVRVKAYDSPAELAAVLTPVRSALQTAGLAVSGTERAEYIDVLSRAGARRLCAIGRMNLPAIDELKDGVMELHRLVRWVEGVV